MEKLKRMPSDSAVLVIDDESLIRMFAADVLMDTGYRVFERVMPWMHSRSLKAGLILERSLPISRCLTWTAWRWLS